MTEQSIKEIAEGLHDLEREWITGWKGVAGAAFNAVAMDLYHAGLLVGPLNWNLNELGTAVRSYLQEQADA